METCKNCKFWRDGYQGKTCDKIEIGYPQQNKKNEFYLLYNVWDDSGLDIALITGPDFGCIQFEAKQ